MRRLLPSLLFVLLAFAGCGESKTNDAPVGTLLKDTFSGGKSVKSGDLAVTLGFQAEGLPKLTGPVAFKLSGPFESQGAKKLPQFDFDLDIAAGGQTVEAGAVSLGDHGFLKLQGKSYTVDKALFDQFRQGYEKSQASASSKEDGPSFKALGIDPSRWLTDAQKMGTTEVGGTDTFHIAAKVDVPRFLDDVDALLKKAQVLGAPQGQLPKGIDAVTRAAIASSVKTADIDVYTGAEDHALRRLTLNVSLDVPAALQGGAGGLKSGELRFDLTIADLNEDVSIPEPKGARPLSELQRTVASNGTSTGTTTTPPAAQTTTTPAPASTTASGGAPPEYLQCVQDAGQDVAKVQACADLINGR